MDHSSSILRGNPAHTVLDIHTKSPYRGLLDRRDFTGRWVPGQRIMVLSSRKMCLCTGLSVTDMWVDCPCSDSWMCPSAYNLIHK